MHYILNIYVFIQVFIYIINNWIKEYKYNKIISIAKE